jgi:hypothetical protein
LELVRGTRLVIWIAWGLLRGKELQGGRAVQHVQPMVVDQKSQQQRRLLASRRA